MKKIVIFIILLTVLTSFAFAEGLTKEEISAMWKQSRQNELEGKPKFYLWVDAWHSSGDRTVYYSENAEDREYQVRSRYAWQLFEYMVYKDEREGLNRNLVENIEAEMQSYFIGKCKYAVVDKAIFQMQNITEKKLYDELRKKGVKFLVRMTADFEGSGIKTNVSEVVDKIHDSSGWAGLLESAFTGNKIVVNYSIKFININDGEVYFAKTIKSTDKNFSLFGLTSKTTREGYFDTLRKGIEKFFTKECIIKVDEGEYITLPETIQARWDEIGKYNDYNIRIYYPGNIKLSFKQIGAIKKAFQDADPKAEVGKYKMLDVDDSKSKYYGMKFMEFPIKNSMMTLEEIGGELEEIKIDGRELTVDDFEQDEYGNTENNINFIIE